LSHHDIVALDLIGRRRRDVSQHEAHELSLIGNPQGAVEAFLEADGGKGFATQSAAAD
jgi:hypothetical protein